jgi:hypothetical protein
LSLSRSLMFAGALAFVLPAAAFAQPNVVNGRNVKLQSLTAFLALGRTGTFPNGTNGCAETTTSCNPGTNNIPWNQTMSETHPFISFIAARQTNGRLTQINDRSFVKHGFFATNSGGCGSCQNPGTSSLLGINCSDTYTTANNGDNYWLAPADEIDPWTGAWESTCSHFDKGEPAVALPQQCDNIRSLSQTQASALNPVGHRMRILDSELNVPGSQFFVHGQYTTQGEVESLRFDNSGWRTFTPTWTGASWSISVSGTLQYTSILNAWTGATVTSNTNGADDGRVFVAVRVTGPVAGIYHYEYAIHNRDNARGINSFRLPHCSSTPVTNAGFDDVDTDGTNSWTLTQSGGELVWTTANNPLKWNSFYNFWFDSPLPPSSGNSTVVQANPGAGAASFTIGTTVPTFTAGAVTNLGGGCGTPAVPSLVSLGTPSLGNATWGLQTSGVAANASTLLWASLLSGSLALNANCTLNMNVAGLFLNLSLPADGAGVVTLQTGVPNDPNLMGINIKFASWEIQTGGAVQNQADLSNTLSVTFGDC